MNSMKLLQQTTVIGLVLLFIVECGAPATSAPTSTSMPPTATITLTPIPPTSTITPAATASIYKSDDLGVTFKYPDGWYVSSPDKGFIAIASKENLQPMQNPYNKGEIVMEIIGVPPDLKAIGDPIAILNEFTNFMGIDMPDKEPAHIVNLNGKNFIIGTYSENYIKTAGNGDRAPLFFAVYFTDQNILLVDMYATTDNEVQLRKVFEYLLTSIEPIPLTEVPDVANPANVPALEVVTMTGDDGMILVHVPAGEFTMGSDNGEADEKPVHTVTLDAFWIDQTEVTNGMYSICVKGGDCKEPSEITHYFDPTYANHPVVYVSWADANAYCSWANRRLPTEAEWEKAASWNEVSQGKRIYPWGDDIDCSLANCVGTTTAVGSYPDGASPYGALDMAGNVWEWVSSLYRDYPYDVNDGRENLSVRVGVGSENWRVLRGGSWFDFQFSFVSSASRNESDPTNSYDHFGFRCARSP